MTIGWKRVYVFISSTFSDMHAERDYLVKRVFPQLRDWCERRKLQLVDVDLRWGVTEADATRNRNVLRTCLKRIDDCRPFFVCFLGQRRGWIPSKDDVSRQTFDLFPAAAAYIGRDSVTELEIRHALIEPLHGRAPRDRAKPDEYYEHAKHAFFYLRDRSYLEQLPADPPILRKMYTNEGVENRTERARHDAELKRWRELEILKTAQALNRSVRSYQAKWDPGAWTPELAIPLKCPASSEINIQRWREDWAKVGVSVARLDVHVDSVEAEKARRFNDRFTAGRLTHLECEGEDLGDVILRDLQAGIAARYSEHVEVEGEDDLQREIEQHEAFLFINSEGYIERPSAFRELDEYVLGDSKKTFVLTSDGGIGKSTLLANWIDRCRRDKARIGDATLHFRFIGQSERSTTVPNLLHYMLRELQEFGKVPATTTETVKNPDGNESSREVPLEIPQDPARLYPLWREQLEQLGGCGKVVIVIDAINQLESGLRDLAWIPLEGLAENVKFIMSFKTGEPEADALQARLRICPHVQCTSVQPFDNLDDRRRLIDEYLNEYLKELDDRHVDAIIRAQGAGNPLFLKVVLSELRVFGAFAQLGEKIRSEFGDNPVSAFDAVLKRLQSDPAHGIIKPAEAVPLLFGLIANARHGLSTDELTDLFLEHLDLDRNLAAHREAAQEEVYVLLRQVQRFFARRVNRYDFFYESFLLAAQKRYAGERRRLHGQLARLFHRIADPSGDGSWTGANPRGVSELPYHECHGDYIVEALADLAFVEAKCRAELGAPLLEDYARAGDSAPAVAIVAEVVTAAHSWLIEQPRHALPVCFNRLSARDEPAAAPILKRADAQLRRRVWLRTVSPLAETSVTCSFAFSRETTVQAISPDGTVIAGMDHEGNLELHATASGVLLRRSALHVTNPIALAIGGQPMRATYVDIDGFLRCEGSHATLPLRTRETVVLRLQDGSVLAVCEDGALVRWDSLNDASTEIAHGLPPPLVAMLVTPDEDCCAFVAGRDVQLLGSFSLNSPAPQVLTRVPACPRILDASLDRSGHWLLTACEDRSLRVFDVESGAQMAVLHYERAEGAMARGRPHYCGMGERDGDAYLLTHDGMLVHWNWQRNELVGVAIVRAHTDARTFLKMRTLPPDDRVLLSEERRITVLSPKAAAAAPAHRAEVTDCTFLSNGQVVSLCAQSGDVLWSSFERLQPLRREGVRSATALLACGTIGVAVGTAHGQVGLFAQDDPPGSKPRVAQIFSDQIVSLASSSDGQLLAASATGAIVSYRSVDAPPRTIWTVRTPVKMKRLFSAGSLGLYWRWAYLAQGDRLMVLSLGVAPEEELVMLKRYEAATDVAVSPDGRLVCVAGASIELFRWQGDHLAPYFDRPAVATAVAFLGRGTLLAVALADSSWLEIWSIGTGLPTVAAIDAPRRIARLATHEDRVFAGCSSGDLAAWQFRTGERYVESLD